MKFLSNIKVAKLAIGKLLPKTFPLNSGLSVAFSAEPCVKRADDCFDASDESTLKKLSSTFLVYENFISESEEKSLLKQSENYLKRLRYETSHWDNVSILIIC